MNTDLCCEKSEVMMILSMKAIDKINKVRVVSSISNSKK